MSGVTFAPATRKRARARIALAGSSGSGKTFTALTLAAAFGGRVAVIDTEHGSASLYADEFTFDSVEPAGYSPEWLIQALAAAAQAGYATVVVDSLSHFWMGTDGMLEQVDRTAKRSPSRNSFDAWREMRPVERNMVEAMLAYPGHVIVTMRTKTEWVIEENDKGKKVPRKVGLKPEQREGIEYEFDVVADMTPENEFVVTKTRCRALAGAVVRKPDATLGKTIVDWLDAGSAPLPSPSDYRDRAIQPDATGDELLALYQEIQGRRLLGVAVVDDHGDTVTLDQLVKARGADARAREAATQPMTEKTRNRLFVLLGEHGLGGDDKRQERRDYATTVLGVPVESMRDLLEAQAQQLIAQLDVPKKPAPKGD